MPPPAKLGQSEAVDYTHERNGTGSIFFTDPLAGWRKAVLSERRTAVNWSL